MLTHLIIKNLALVERLELELGPGLNIMTGETGAGKSVLVGALSLLLGGRAQSDMIRAGESEGVVEALVDVPSNGTLALRLMEQGIEDQDGQLVIRRIVSRGGRSRVLLNGQMATVGMLGQIIREAVDLTSQHEHVTLLDPETHLNLLDAYGGLDALRQRVGDVFTETTGYRSALDALQIDEAEKARREDYLRFAIDEIDAIAPVEGELERLEAERKRLKGAHELMSGVQQAEQVLYSADGAVVEAVGKVQRELVRLSGLDERLSQVSGTASAVLAELEELARELLRYQGAMEADPARLGHVEDRIDQIRRLVRKYGGSENSVLEAREAMSVELDSLEHEEARRADLLALLEASTERLQEAANDLTAARHKAVRGLEREIKRQLADLSMSGTNLEVRLTRLESPGARGQESAEVMIAPNPGEPSRPLRKSASGGELSRVLLAVKHVLAHRAAVHTFVFDEIDTGIGGAVAEILGLKLREVSQSAQVLAVTHLPQVAAYADRHFRVHKVEDGGRTMTQVEMLDEPHRIDELARMLGGVEVTPRTRSLAEELRGRATRRDRTGGTGRGRRARGAGRTSGRAAS